MLTNSSRLVHPKDVLGPATTTLVGHGGLFPDADADAITRFSGGPSYVRYARESVEATDLPSVPPRLKKMVNSFHHMRAPMHGPILGIGGACSPAALHELTDNAVPFPLWPLFTHNRRHEEGQLPAQPAPCKL